MFLLRLMSRRLGPVGLVFAAVDLWRHLPPRIRRRLAGLGRRAGLLTLARARVLLSRFAG